MDYDEPSNLEVNYRSGETVYPKIDWKEPLKVEVEHFISCIKELKNVLLVQIML